MIGRQPDGTGYRIYETSVAAAIAAIGAIHGDVYRYSADRLKPYKYCKSLLLLIFTKL